MSLNISGAQPVRPPLTAKLSMAQHNASLWKRGVAFIFGFGIEFNFLTGVGGAEASTSLYGYRLIDILAFGAVGLLGFYSLVRRRIVPLALYSVIVVALFLPVVLSAEPHSMILASRYLLYSLGAFYVAVVISEVSALEWFCWGLIVGLLANVAIFVIQDSQYESALVDWGLTPRYGRTIFRGGQGEFLRYSGLYGHPNEAGHVAALSAAAGAWLAVARRRLIPIVFILAGSLAIFYYTRSRAGLFVSGAILILSILITQARMSFFRLSVVLVVIIISVVFLSQLDFVASRFSDDPLAAYNVSERLDSTLTGLRTLLANPFGMPIDEFSSYLRTESGVATPHNGFIFLGGVLGLLPLSALLIVFVASVRVHDAIDVFFAFLAAQVALSFLFEQLSVSSPYQFAVCLIGARVFLRTRIGRLCLGQRT